MHRSKNLLVALMSKVALNGSRSFSSNSLTYICAKYNICKYELSKRDIKKVSDSDSEDTVLRASILSDFLEYRGIPYDQDVSDIIEYLCTS